MKADFENRLETVLQAVQSVADMQPDYGLITGTGMGALINGLQNATRIAYADIEGFPHSTVPGHEGALYLGELAGKRVAIFSGRFHLYEGWAPDDIVLPIYLLKKMGAKAIFITNAVGSLNPDFKVGDLCLITDHINLQGVHALTGPNPDNLGSRFPDLSQIYSKTLQQFIEKKSKSTLRKGIYAAVHGPELETNAERRYLCRCGADVVGMSTVMEVVACAHAGLDHAVISVITNMATGDPGQAADTLDNILKQSEAALPRLQALLSDVLEAL